MAFTSAPTCSSCRFREPTPPGRSGSCPRADGKYRLGQFDGHKFTSETDKLTLWHGDFYAAQTFSEHTRWSADPDRLGAWTSTFPGMPFNQQMTFPCELNLADHARMDLASAPSRSRNWRGFTGSSRRFQFAVGGVVNGGGRAVRGAVAGLTMGST